MNRRKLAALLLSVTMMAGTILSPLGTAAAELGAEAYASEYVDDDVFYEDDAADEVAPDETYAEPEIYADDDYADDDGDEEASDFDEPEQAESLYEENDDGASVSDTSYEADDAEEEEAAAAAESEVSSEAEAVLDEEGWLEHEGGSISFPEDERTNDELFSEYIDSQFFESEQAAQANYGEKYLKGDIYSLKLYRAAKSKLKAIAKNGGSTDFTASFTVTTSDGPSKSTIETIYRTGYPTSTWLGSSSSNKSYQMFNILLADLPYELYWFDKTYGCNWRVSTRYNNSAHTSVTVSFNYQFFVAREYSTTGSISLKVKSGVSAVSTAVSRAKSIVEKHKSKSDYAKLLAYRDEICNLTDYNWDAINYNYSYGNPWQLIWVFDGKASTKVVCEGYSKAFQYLCDLSTFSDVVCYTMTGTMEGGAHMWNVVRWRGKAYLCDVTNVDFDKYNWLFMVSGMGTEYAFTVRTDSGNVYYVYNEMTRKLYGSTVRKLGDGKAYSYTDVSSSKFFYYPTLWAITKGITTGVSAGKFKPDQTVTRGQMVTFLYRMAGSPSVSASNRFKDVSSSSVYAKAVTWALNKGITTGTSYYYFSPNKPCTRAQIVTMLYRAKGSPSVSTTNRFYDVSSSAFYAKAVTWAVNKGITTGTSYYYFSPDSSCTRAQAVTFLYRSC